MRTKLNKKFWLFAAALAFAVTLFAKPVDVKAAVATPTNVKQTGANDGAVAIAWDKVAGASAYGVQYSTNGISWSNLSSSYVDSYAAKAEIYYLASGSTYLVRVCSYGASAADASAYTAPIKVDTAPGKLTGLKQTDAGKKTATIQWTAVSGATGYDVYYAASSSAKPKYYGEVGGTSVKVSLPVNSAYYIIVYPYRNAANPQNYALDSDNGAVTVGVTTPSTPKSLSVYDGSFDYKQLGIKWKSTSTVYNTDGFEYEVLQLKTSGKTSKIKKTTTKSTYAVVTSSKLFSSPCKFRVRSYVTINGKKKYSAWSSYKIYVPQAVQTKLTAKSETQATLKWSKVNGAKNYSVYRKTGGKWTLVKKNVKGTSATVGCSRYGNNYYYVKANKVKVGKKTYSSASPNNAPFYDPGWYFKSY